ncbi:hypothetical protein LPJ56_001885, partial [Coemansia sp. RSA 2599]
MSKSASDSTSATSSTLDITSKSWSMGPSVTSSGLFGAGQGTDGQVIELSTHIVSPLTLQSDDVVEFVVSHVRTTASASSSISSNDSSSGIAQPTPDTITSASRSVALAAEPSWVSTPAAHELFEVAEPTEAVDDYSAQILPKRSFRTLKRRGPRGYRQGDESEDAARSARSLLSAMREIATRSENASPKRQSQISVIRSALDKQMIYPDDVVLDDDDYRDHRNDHYNVDDHPAVYHNDDNNLGRNVYDHGDNNCVWHADHNCCDHHDNNDNNNNNCNVYNSDKPDYCNCYRDNHQYHAYCVDQLVYHCSAPGNPNYNHCHVYASADYNIGFH